MSTASEHGSSPIGQEADVGKWQPIEMAPKDGTRILLWVPKAGSTTGGFDPSWSGNCWVYDNSRIKRDMEPSHWMPIPAPPTTSTAGR